jgi:hypothetical protein
MASSFYHMSGFRGYSAALATIIPVCLLENSAKVTKKKLLMHANIDVFRCFGTQFLSIYEPTAFYPAHLD